jgi:hypothetical protein
MKRLILFFRRHDQIFLYIGSICFLIASFRSGLMNSYLVWDLPNKILIAISCLCISILWGEGIYQFTHRGRR